MKKRRLLGFAAIPVLALSLMFGVSASAATNPTSNVAQPQVAPRTANAPTSSSATTLHWISTAQNHAYCVTDPSGGGVGTHVVIWGNNGTFCQTESWFKWKFITIPGGPYAGNFTIQSAANGLCISNAGGDAILTMQPCNTFDGGQAWYGFTVGTSITQFDSFANSYPCMANSHDVIGNGNPVVGYLYQENPTPNYEQWVDWV